MLSNSTFCNRSKRGEKQGNEKLRRRRITKNKNKKFKGQESYESIIERGRDKDTEGQRETERDRDRER